MANKEILNAFIIGTGSAGERHAKAQMKLGMQTVVYDADSEKATRLSKKYGFIVARDLEEAIQGADIIHICTPDHLHTEYALQGIKSGKDILTEKPMVTNLIDALLVQEAVREHGTKFLVGANYRLTPTFLEVKSRKDSDCAGHIISIYTSYIHDMREYQQKTPWRLNQDFLYGGGIHAIDLACWIMGERVVEVQAMKGINRIPNYKKPEDYRIALKFKSGVVGSIWLNARVSQVIHGTDLKVYCEEGNYETHNNSEFVDIYDAKTGTQSVKKVGISYTIDEEVSLVDQWLLGKREDHKPLPGINEAVDIIRVIDAIERAAESGKTEKVYYQKLQENPD